MSRNGSKKQIVVSGINLFAGGPLSIYYDCLDAFCTSGLSTAYRLTAFVHKKELFRAYEDLVQLIELPASRQHYLLRLYYEYVYFMQYSKKHDIALWLSLHDITPKVKADQLYTYCHNPSPFFAKDLSMIKYGVKNTAFCLFYRYLYRINIKSADAVIVQQDWMRRAFVRMYPVRRVIVARPEVLAQDRMDAYAFRGRHAASRQTVFFYAAYPRYFKNYEVLLQACRLLQIEGVKNWRVWITVFGDENRYAKKLRARYGFLQNVEWLGIQPREKIFALYDRADCLVFPSLMETWGLPISEFRHTGKDMILADLPYAHETAGGYKKVMYFAPKDARALAGKMKEVLKGQQVYDVRRSKHMRNPDADNWEQLWEMLLEGCV